MGRILEIESERDMWAPREEYEPEGRLTPKHIGRLEVAKLRATLDRKAADGFYSRQQSA
jgi:hypothetical protein